MGFSGRQGRVLQETAATFIEPGARAPGCSPRADSISRLSKLAV